LGARFAVLAALFAAAALALVAGCGEDQREAYADDYRPLSRDLIALGESVGRAVQSAEGKSDEQLEREFDGFADQLGRLRRDLEQFEPPDDLAPVHDELVEAMRAAETALRGIEEAAAASDPEAARRSTIELARASEDLRDARVELTRRTR
jgi:hypothetical protein